VIDALENGDLILPTGRRIGMKRHLPLLQKNETYTAYLTRLSLREGLIAETLRLAASGLAEMRRSVDVAKALGTPQTYRMVCLDPFLADFTCENCRQRYERVWESIGRFLKIDHVRFVASAHRNNPREGNLTLDRVAHMNSETESAKMEAMLELRGLDRTVFNAYLAGEERLYGCDVPPQSCI
jgi:hypothetical protein